MVSDFETGLMAYLGSNASSPAEKKLKRWFEKNPKGPLHKKLMNRLSAQADAMVANATIGKNGMFSTNSYNAFTAIDWQKLLSALGPFIMLLLSLFN